MEAVADQLINALRERLELIADEHSRQAPALHLEKLKRVSEQISTLEARLPDPVHPQLAHYLQRASYSKALEFLENARRAGSRPT